MNIRRPYQEQALAAFWSRIAEHGTHENRLAIEMATGLGKTVTGAAGAIQWRNKVRARENRALILVHTDEIAEQWLEKLRFAASNTPWVIGLVKAGTDQPRADIVVASVQTLVDPSRREAITNVGFIIVDECHHAVAPTYQTLLQHYGAMSGVPTLGLTATLARSDGQALGNIWQDLVFSRGIGWAQRRGYLLEVVPWAIRVPEITELPTDVAMDAMLADSIAPEAVVTAWMEKAVGLCEECRAAVGEVSMLPSYCPNATCGIRRPPPSTVLFAPLVKSAELFAGAFSKAGVKAEVIHGALPPVERANILQRYNDGTTTILCNAMVLTEGWDSPRTMCVIWARPAKGGPLFIQGVGRGLRPWLDVSAPPREEQRCTLLCVTDASGASLAIAADLSDRPIEIIEGKSITQVEDEYDLGKHLDDESRSYAGPVSIEQWEPLVAASTKAWRYTKDGIPFLPIAKRQEGYIFIVDDGVYLYGRHPRKGTFGARKLGAAPDRSLAMALAEDEAHERGGDVGALLADKTRPWRKTVPTLDAIQYALSAGVEQWEIDRIMKTRSAGKAGKLSDRIDTVVATRVLDPLASRIRVGKP